MDMTADERSIMEKHVGYWSEAAVRGIAIVFGPVMNPKGVYGIAVCRVADEAEMRDLLERDPAKGLLQYEILPMPRAVVGTAVHP
jgi:hypothetical protein